MSIAPGKRARLLAFGLVSLFYLGVEGSPASVNKYYSVLVVSSSDAVPYQNALKGFKDYLDGKVNIRFDSVVLDRNADNSRQAYQEKIKNGTDLIFTLGSSATKALTQEHHSRPIISGLILNSAISKGMSGITGVILEHPLDVQFEWLSHFFPNVKNIGVLFNPEENGEKVKQAKTVARKYGKNLVAIEVANPKELPYALESIAKHAQVIWSIPDRIVMSPKSARAILLSSFRHKVPLVGLSNAWVKAGALYALDWDYVDIGAQCGEVALAVLQGAAVNDLALTFPRKIFYSLNLKTASHMKLDIPNSLIVDAQKTFK